MQVIFERSLSKQKVTPYSLEKNLKYLQERLRDMDTSYTLNDNQMQQLKEKFHGNVSEAIETFVARLGNIIDTRIKDKSISRKQALKIQVKEVERLSQKLLDKFKSKTMEPIKTIFQTELQGIETAIQNTTQDWKKVSKNPKMSQELYTQYLDKTERIRNNLMKKSMEILQKFQDAGLTQQDFEKSGLVEQITKISESIEKTLSSIQKFDQSKKEAVFLTKLDKTAANYERDLRAAKSFEQVYKTGTEMITSLLTIRDLAANTDIFLTEKKRAQFNQKINDRVQKFNETFFQKCTQIVTSINKELDGIDTSQDLAKLYAQIAQHSIAIDGMKNTLEGPLGGSIPKQSRIALKSQIDLAQNRLKTLMTVLNNKLKERIQTTPTAPKENISVVGGAGDDNMQANIGKIEQGAHVVINITKQAGMPGMPEIANLLSLLQN